MKKQLLFSSACAAATATTISVGTAILASNPETVLRATGVCYTIGLLSISLFFIGLVTPKEY